MTTARRFVFDSRQKFFRTPAPGKKSYLAPLILRTTHSEIQAVNN